jgi:alkylation response protein AidB-like acyl-CoA dehydrogenase
MDLALTDDQSDFIASIRSFVADRCPPSLLNRFEEDGEYPADLYREMAGLGWVGLVFPERYGGSEVPATYMTLLAEELGRAGYDFSAGLGIRIFCGLNLVHFGTEEQKQRYLPPLISGDLLFSTSITEPGSGSDAASMTTRAEKVDGGWVLNGSKMYTTAAHVPGAVLQVYCRTDRDKPRHKGLSVLMVPNDAPGVSVQRLKAIGRNMVGTNIVHFDDVRVPDDALLGEREGGWSVLMESLKMERLFIASAYVGAAQSVVDEALAYAKEREQFGKRIGDFQVIAHMLADMQTRVDAMRAMAYRAAWLVEQRGDCMREVAQAKLFGAENFYAVAGDGMQIMGGYGYMAESVMQRHFLDARSATITGGTSQMQRTIIARSLGLRPS